MEPDYSKPDATDDENVREDVGTDLPNLVALNPAGLQFCYRAEKHADGTITEKVCCNGKILDPHGLADVRSHVLCILQTGKPAEID